MQYCSGCLTEKGDAACWRTYLAFFNIVFVITGCAVIVIGWWMKYSLSKFLEFSADITCELPFLIMLTGFLIIFIGCSASVCLEKPLLQVTYGGCLVLFFMLEIVLVIFLFVYERGLHEHFGKSLNESIASYSDDMRQQSTMDLIQMKLECCGYNGYYDWYCSSIRKVPPSCCKKRFCDTTKAREIFLVGCYDKVFQYINSNMKTVLRVVSLAAFLPLVGAVLAFCLAYHVFTLHYQPIPAYNGNA